MGGGEVIRQRKASVLRHGAQRGHARAPFRSGLADRGDGGRRFFSAKTFKIFTSRAGFEISQ